jgi:MoxR-like ATPase
MTRLTSALLCAAVAASPAAAVGNKGNTTAGGAVVPSVKLTTVGLNASGAGLNVHHVPGLPNVGSPAAATPLHKVVAITAAITSAIPQGLVNAAARMSGASDNNPVKAASAGGPGSQGKGVQATLGVVQASVAAMPGDGKGSAGDSKSAGDNLAASLNGEKVIAAAGTAAAANNDEESKKAALEALKAKVAQAKQTAEKILAEVSKVIVGQDEMKKAILMAMIAREHVLLEGLPGVAKTQTAKAFADAVQGSFNRVQGTADRLPSDVTGSEIFDAKTGDFKLVKGPVFTNILLMDEINRMPPKAQSALLEAMAEGQVTIGGKTMKLERFTVLATQNPVEQDGTYRLPEAQLDRFMLKVLVPQPSAEELKAIVRVNAKKEARPQASKVTNLDELDEMRRTAESLTMGEDVEDYIVRVAMAASGADYKKTVDYTVYTRAAIYLSQAARINALLRGSEFVTMLDVRAVAPMVLRHRIALSFEGQSNQNVETFIETLLGRVNQRILPTGPAGSGLKTATK